ncbi:MULTISPECIES: fimbrial protein [Serratia]|jgi:minor fimbrial subunit|uniref:fimbrial protein n=1 Tax=Serratia TaxID=613 RepID=UPI000B617A8C|nr:fimbrial protein [Serratia marcescens]ASL90495.1 fimbrial protein [Serratia marcescens]ELI8816671.1 fimbrial protein [Serratia marcescens]ELI8845342.1 fimbrial protein [Serratia marcescens]ELY1863451.1 fimbrial protein [Serratia marcescens]MBH3198392.1 fimbrial protein [Serratia marcescens]
MTLVSKLKKVLKKKEVAALVASVCLMAYSSGANAFTCKVNATGQTVGSGSANVYVNLTPSIGVGQNLIVDLSSQIQCKNDSTPPNIDTDYVKLTGGSAYGGVLDNFNGTVYWNGKTYPMPLNTNTDNVVIRQTYYQGLPFKLYLTALGAAGGKAVKSGELIAVMRMYKIATFGGGYPRNFTWNIYANNNVIIPTGGCDVSSRNVTVTLPDYPGTAAVPLTVHCAQNQQLAYYLTGTTADTASTIFTNTSSSNPATGVGVQLSNRNGIVATNKNVSLGTVGTSPQSLGLTASYARTTGQVVAGNVQSIIGVTFVYE